MKHQMFRRIVAGCLSALMLVMSPMSTVAGIGSSEFAVVKAGEAVATASEASPSQIEKEEAAFEQSREADGVIVTVKADPGVFPENAKLSVKIVSRAKDLKKVGEAVAKEQPKNIADQYVFDISVLVNGEEVEPDTAKGTVQVSFALAEVHDENSELEVFHVTEEEDGLVAESLEVEEEIVDNEDNAKRDEETVVTVETEGFSVYVVAFTYNDLAYTFGEGHEAKISEIMEAAGLTGEVEDAKISDDKALTLEKGENSADWVLKENKEFEDEKLTLTVNGKEYDVNLKDSGSTVIYWQVIPSTQTLVITMDDGVAYEACSGEFYADQEYNSAPWSSYTSSFKKVVIDTKYGTPAPHYMTNWFKNNDNITSADLRGLDTSNVTSFAELFKNCSDLTSVNLSGLDTSNATSFAGMFYYCSNLVNVNLSNLDTSKVTDMSSMFYNCMSLAAVDLSALDTDSVTDMSSMFYWCNSLESLDLSELSFASVTTVRYMFYHTIGLKTLDLSSFTTLSNVYVDGLFYESHVETLDLSGANTINWTKEYYYGYDPFYYTYYLQEVTLGPGWNNNYQLPTPSSSYVKGADGKWHTKAGGSFDPSQVTTNEGTVTFYSVFVKYKVQFNANGGTGSAAEKRVNSTETFALPGGSFSRKGYTLTGWKDNYNRTYSKTQTVGNLTTTQGDVITMYAQWTPITYKIAFNKNGGTGSTMTTKTATYDKALTLPSNTYKKTNYTFLGWNTKADGKGTTYKNKASVKNLAYASGKTITLYAVWGFSVTYKLNGGTNSKKNPSTMKKGASFTLQKPTKAGYTFGGWYTNSACSSSRKITALNSKTLKKNIVLYAKWTANTYTIKYNANGGKGSMASTKATYGKSLKLRANTLTRSGYKFIGWNTKKNGTGKSYSDKASVKNLTSASKGTVTLYAQWEKPLTTKVTLKTVTKTKYNKNTLTYSVSGSCTGVEVWRSTKSGSGYKLLGTTTSKTSCVDSSAEAGTTYYYKLRAYKTSNGRTQYAETYSGIKSVKTALKPSLGGKISGVYRGYVQLKVGNSGNKTLAVGGSKSGMNYGQFYPAGSSYVPAYLYNSSMSTKLSKQLISSGTWSYAYYKYSGYVVNYYTQSKCVMAFMIEYDDCSYAVAIDYYGNGLYQMPVGEEGVKLDSSNCRITLDGLEYTPDCDLDDLKEQ